jgi:hypothetical protein
MRDDLVEDAAHLERGAVFLIDEDVASRKRGLIEMPDKRFLAQWQLLEPICVQLHNRGIVHTFQ